MELSQLEVFLAVAREHRFSRAAEKLFRYFEHNLPRSAQTQESRPS